MSGAQEGGAPVPSLLQGTGGSAQDGVWQRLRGPRAPEAECASGPAGPTSPRCEPPQWRALRSLRASDPCGLPRRVLPVR